MLSLYKAYRDFANKQFERNHNAIIDFYLRPPVEPAFIKLIESIRLATLNIGGWYSRLPLANGLWGKASSIPITGTLSPCIAWGYLQLDIGLSSSVIKDTPVPVGIVLVSTKDGVLRVIAVNNPVGSYSMSQTGILSHEMRYLWAVVRNQPINIELPLHSTYF